MTYLLSLSEQDLDLIHDALAALEAVGCDRERRESACRMQSDLAELKKRQDAE